MPLKMEPELSKRLKRANRNENLYHARTHTHTGYASYIFLAKLYNLPNVQVTTKFRRAYTTINGFHLLNVILFII